MSRVEESDWTLEVVRGWSRALDGASARASLAEGSHPDLVDHLPPGEYDSGTLQVAVTVPGGVGPNLLVTLGYHRLDGDFGAGAILVPEARRLFVAGGNRALCYRHDGDRWSREWEHEVAVMVWGLARHGDLIVMSSELELVAWDISGARRLTAAVEPSWSYEIQGNRMRLDINGRVTTVDIPAVGEGPRDWPSRWWQGWRPRPGRS